MTVEEIEEVLKQLIKSKLNLESRIDKAIRYIVSRANNAGVKLMPREKILIEILRGEDNGKIRF